MHFPCVLRSDQGLQQWIKKDADPHLEGLPGRGAVDCVDLSQNNLTDKGVDDLVRFLVRRRQKLLRLKLFKNKLCEPRGLCDLVRHPDCGVGGPDGLAELHLSHNQLSFSWLEALLYSIGGRIKESQGLRQPLWLRVENNGSLAEDAWGLSDQDEKYGMKLCFRGGTAKSGCGIRRCRHGADVHLVLAVNSRA